MKEAINVIRKIAAITDKAVLFHSATGKDSIALLDLMHPYFKEILCVYMYVVKDMEHINKYIGWAQRHYPKARFIQTPHFANYNEIRLGYLGCKQNPNQKLYSLSDLTDIVRVRYNIEWAFFGFKMSDSFKRRLMLRNYTPDKLAPSERNELCKLCDDALIEAVEILKPEFVVGIGTFAYSRAKSSLTYGLSYGHPEIIRILHPSPANPRANKDWAGKTLSQLTALGVWK